MTSVADRDDPTTALHDADTSLTVRELLDHGVVYRPQQDSYLLIEAVRASDSVVGADAADLCTGSGVVARAVAHLGARSVVAVDTCADAVRVARAVTADTGGRVSVEHGDIAGFRGRTFDLITCNPPYVPSPPDGSIEERECPRAAWEAGIDGRSVLDLICASAVDLLAPGGSIFLVQSEFADVARTVRTLQSTGLDAQVALTRAIPFGPVLTAHAEWLEQRGQLDSGRRTELLAVVRAHKEVDDRRRIGR